MKNQLQVLLQAIQFINSHFGIIEEINPVMDCTDKRYALHDDGAHVLIGDDLYKIASGHPRSQYETDSFHCFFIELSVDGRKQALAILSISNRLKWEEVQAKEI